MLHLGVQNNREFACVCVCVCAYSIIYRDYYLGPNGESNPGPLAPKASIIPLDHSAINLYHTFNILPYLSYTRQDFSESVSKALPKDLAIREGL